MITRQELAGLAALRHEEGIVSAFVAYRARLMHQRSHPATGFKSAAKRFLQKSSDARWKAALEREEGRVLAALDQRKPEGRGIVFFACEPAGLWEVRTLAVPIPTFVTVETTPHTALLAQILDEFPRFAVVLVQKDRARLYLSEQADASEVGEIASEVEGVHSQGGWSQARFQRHIEEQVHDHFKKILEELTRLDRETPFKRLVVGGPEQPVSDFLKVLPAPLAQRVIGTFTVDLKHEGDDEILASARRVLEEDERRSESEMVRQLLDAAHSGGAGVIGLEGTVSALLEGRVRTMLVAGGNAKDGAVCPHCDYFEARLFRRCPLCGAEADEAPDVVELAMERAILSGAHVEALFGEAKDALLEQGHGVGALLRY